MRQILILADDLSGAADCATACLGAGLKAVVSFDEHQIYLQCDVEAVDCNTRHLGAEQAAERVKQVMGAYRPSSSSLMLIKKVDSALRGNVGVEVAAVLMEQRRAARQQRVVAVIAPAFPLSGRTTIDGYQLVHGKPVHETEMWIHDGLGGVAHVPTLLENAGLVTVGLNLRLVRSGVDQLSAAMQKHALVADALVCDAETDEDLRAIAIASLSLGPRTVWVGSAGLTYRLPEVAGIESKNPAIDMPEFRDGPSLFVIGSMSSISGDQAARLAQQAAVHIIYVAPRTLLAGPQSTGWRDAESSIGDSLHAGNDTLVKLDAGEKVEHNQRHLLTQALGVMLTPHRYAVGALVASGGETARAVLTGWGVPSLRLVSEVEHGLPFSIAEFEGVSLPVLTKAGSFGKPETLLNCLDFLKGLERHSGIVGRRTQGL